MQTHTSYRSKRMVAASVSLIVVTVLALAGCAYVQQAKFGAPPAGDRLERVQRSPNYVNGEFQNSIPTPMFSDDSSFVRVVLSNLFSSKEGLRPTAPMPSIKTDLKALDRGQDTVIWLGHSSFFVQLDGRRILIDPVFSTSAAPLPNVNTAFDGASVFTADDMPEIDLLLITHDHWDHLDYPSIIALERKTKAVIGGLGVGAHFEHWGYPKEKIREGDWFAAFEVERALTVHVLPARHYSGRTFTRNKTLWVGYALETPKRRLFFSGDSGYGAHFDEIGRKFGGFDLVVLDTGQYDKRWAHIHMTPDEAVRAAEALKGRALLPAHVGRFALARHAWNEPFRRIAPASEGKSYTLVTPLIGEPVTFANAEQPHRGWWDRVD